MNVAKLNERHLSSMLICILHQTTNFSTQKNLSSNSTAYCRFDFKSWLIGLPKGVSICQSNSHFRTLIMIRLGDLLPLGRLLTGQNYPNFRRGGRVYILFRKNCLSNFWAATDFRRLYSNLQVTLQFSRGYYLKSSELLLITF